MLDTAGAIQARHFGPVKSFDCRVLIVEDDPDAAAVTAKLLSAKGYHAYVVTSAVEALRSAAREPFSLALVDISLGGELDGVDVAEWLSRLYRTPIVFATSAIDDDTLIRARRIRPSGYLVKPIEPSQLFSTVTLALGEPAGAAAASSPTPEEQVVFLRRKLDQVKEVVEEMQFTERAASKQTGRLRIGVEELSPREWQIMQDLVKTPSVEAVAARRHLSTHTVQNHLKAIFRKLEVHSMAELLSLLLSD